MSKSELFAFRSAAAILGICLPKGQSTTDETTVAGSHHWKVMTLPDASSSLWRCVVFLPSRAAAKRDLKFTVMDDSLLHLAVRKGLPFACAQNVASVLDMPMTRLYDLINVSPSTAHRRKNDQVLSKTESDRLARIARVTADACRVFGDMQTAKRWLARKHAVLGGMTPLELLDTDSGAEQVADELTRIEFGELAA